MMLGAGPLQVPAILKLKELGYFLILCDYNPNALGMKFADIPLIISTVDKEAVLLWASQNKPDFVMTSTTDAPMRTVAYVCEKLGLPCGNSYEDSICATVKSEMRDRLKKFGVPIPRYYKCESLDEFISAVRSFDRECIIKPSDSAASRGVELIKSCLSDTDLTLKYNLCKSCARNGIVMVEEFMRGDEVSVECFIVNGRVNILAITDKLVTPLPYFVEIGHSEQSLLPEEIKSKIINVTRRAIGAIGIKNGVSHTEIKVTEEGPKIVELAARLGGDYIASRLVPLSTGIDMVGNSVLQSLGESVDIAPKFNKGSAIRFIYGNPGVLKNLYADEKLKELKGVREVEFYSKPGDKVNALHSSNDRLGHVIVQADTAKEAINIADAALKNIKVEIE